MFGNRKASQWNDYRGKREARPLVSIGVPVYNGGYAISEALDSLVHQSYTNLEIIVCDNASNDNTQAICLEYAHKDPRLRYYRNLVNIGSTRNFRRVLELASGDYFMWACADDIRPTNAVQVCLDALEANKQAVMAYGVIHLRLKGQKELIQVKNIWDNAVETVDKRIRAYTKGITSQCISYGLYRKWALEKVVYSNCYGQEYLLLLQLCLYGSFQYVDYPIIVYSIRKQVVSDDPIYEDSAISLKTLITEGWHKRWKCWTLLVMGSYYLSNRPGVKLHERATGIKAHVLTFIQLHQKKLSKELVFQLFAPISWISFIGWKIARRWDRSSAIVDKIRSLVFKAY